MPPTGRILPVSETSPVMATLWRTGVLVASDSSAVTMVQPALGPSLGVAPYRHQMVIRMEGLCVKKYIHKIKHIHNKIHTYIIHTYTSRTHCLTCLKLILWAYLFCSAHRHTYTLTCSTVSSYWPQEHAGEGGTWLEIHFLALCSSERLWRRSKLFLHFPSWRRPVDLWSKPAPISNSLLDRGGPNYGPGPYVTSEDFRSTWRLTFTVSHLNLSHISSVFRVIFKHSAPSRWF